MQIESRYGLYAVAVSILITGVYPTKLLAQATLEEIVVTAQRRVQNLQDVPISIEIVSGVDIETQGFRDMEALAVFTPALDIDSGEQNSQSIRIRGVGSDSNNLALEQSVPMFIDGVHYGRGSNSFNAFLDVERVEVLRGPQPIYFGQNATAGAISVVNRKPSAEWEGYVLAETGNDAVQMGEFGAGGPISDTVGVRVAGKYDKSEGFMRDVVKNTKFPEREAFAGRVTFEWNPSDALQVTTKLDYVNIDKAGRGETPVDSVARPDKTLGAALTGDFDAVDIAGLFEQFNVDSINNIGIEHSGPWFRLPLTVFDGIGSPQNSMADLSVIGNTLEVGPASELKQTSAYLEFVYEFGNEITLTSQTSFARLDRFFARDGSTRGPWLIAGTNRFEDQDQLSQEIRLSSATGGFLEWMVGGYWENIDLNVGSKSVRAAIQSITAPRSNIQGNNHVEDDTWLSIFAAITLNFSDQLSFDLGARYTDISKEGKVIGLRAWWLDENGVILNGVADHGRTAFGMTSFDPTGNETEADFDDNDLSPQIVLRWRPTESISTYLKYATAIKAGGFDGSVTRVLPIGQYVYDSEFSENWELGVKGTAMDGAANYSLTLFHNQFEDMQLTAFDEFLGQSTTNNVAEQRVQGAEFSGRLAVNDQLSLGLSGAIMDGEMTSYPGATCTQDEVFRDACTGIGGTVDRSGFDAIRTPDWAATLGADYSVPIRDKYRIDINALLLISDGFLMDFDQLFVMESHEDLNLRIGFGDQDETWSVSAYARNLLEPLPKHQPEFDHDTFGENLVLSAKNFTTYGIQLRYDF